MDAVNEKRVFDLLVKMTGRPGSSQYFLLTPKVSITTTIIIFYYAITFINLVVFQQLLPKLSYTETVTVHCVFNGTVKADNEDFEFDVKDYCNHLVSSDE